MLTSLVLKKPQITDVALLALTNLRNLEHLSLLEARNLTHQGLARVKLPHVTTLNVLGTNDF